MFLITALIRCVFVILLFSTLQLIYSLSLVLHRAEFLILMKYNLSIISIVDYTLDAVSKKSLLYPSLSRFPFYYLIEVIVFVVFIYDPFQLIFVKGVRSLSRFIFLCMLMSSEVASMFLSRLNIQQFLLLHNLNQFAQGECLL